MSIFFVTFKIIFSCIHTILEFQGRCLTFLFENYIICRKIAKKIEQWINLKGEKKNVFKKARIARI